MNSFARDLLIKLDSALTGFGYAVLEIAELCDSEDNSRFNESLDILKSGGFVIVKYRDDTQVCLCITRMGRTCALRLKADVEQGYDKGDSESGELLPAVVHPARNTSGWQKIKFVAISAIAGLFGGAIGGAIIYLILGAAG